jgi:hypothetical protein
MVVALPVENDAATCVGFKVRYEGDIKVAYGAGDGRATWKFRLRIVASETAAKQRRARCAQAQSHASFRDLPALCS